MDKVIISTKSDKSQVIIKEAKKKAIDEGITFSVAVLQLLEKWLNNEVQINNEVRK